MGDLGPIYFFKEDDPVYGWLCQWYPSPFRAEDGEIVFKHAEQYMMWRKAVTFNDTYTATKILLNSSPRKCKALGRSVANLDSSVWDTHKLSVVEEGSYYKFTNCLSSPDKETLKEKLLATRDWELVEASPFDRVWGVGFSVEELKRGKKSREGREKWGQNLLGKALMATRSRIREEARERRDAVDGL